MDITPGTRIELDIKVDEDGEEEEGEEEEEEEEETGDIDEVTVDTMAHTMSAKVRCIGLIRIFAAVACSCFRMTHNEVCTSPSLKGMSRVRGGRHSWYSSLYSLLSPLTH